jgi:hypothetical protein
VRYHRKLLQRVNSVDDVTALLDADAICIESMRKRIESISSIEVAEFPSVVKEAAREENILVQTAVLDAYLRRMLYYMDGA